MKRASLWSLLTAFTLGLAACTSHLNQPEVDKEFGPPSASPVATELSTSTATSRPTLVPTLNPVEALERIEELLETNGGCELPCWWGLQPENSSSSHALEILTPLSGAAEFPFSEEQTFFLVKESEQRIRLTVNYRTNPDNDRIELIEISTYANREIEGGFEPLYNSQGYQKLFDSLLLHKVLTEFGPPEKVVLSLELYYAEADAPDFFYTLLLYPQRGLIFIYEADALVDGPSARVCPSNSFVSIWLFEPNNPSFFSKVLREVTYSSWDGLIPKRTGLYKFVEDALGISERVL